MALYMLQANFFPSALAVMVEKPQDRAAVFSALLEKLNGRLHNFYYAFGESDVVVVYEVPDDETAFTAVLAVASAGHLTNVKTTKLFSNEKAMENMKRAGSLKVQAPS
jgi:uncharacterized protein with GYD domain